jgi:hypothetical protein
MEIHGGTLGKVAIRALLTLVLMTGCAPAVRQNALPALTAETRQPIEALGLGGREARKPGGLYVSTFFGSTIEDYRIPHKHGQGPACSVTFGSGPGNVNGIGVDGRRVLYIPVPNSSGNSGTVQTFGPDCGPAGPTLTGVNSQPTDVAFDNSNGTVFVDSVTDGVFIYPKGATAPSGVLIVPPPQGGWPSNFASFGVAVNAQHDVFESVSFDQSPGFVAEAKGGTGSLIPLRLFDVAEPGGMEIDDQGNLLVVDGSAGDIVIYKPPFNGFPSAVIPAIYGSAYAKLDKVNENLYVSNGCNAVDVYAYPSGTFKAKIRITPCEFIVDGIAIDPAAAH